MEALASHEVDAVLVSEPHDLRWLSGFTGSSGVMIAGNTIRLFVTDFRYVEQAAEQVAPGIDVAICERELQDALPDRLPDGLILGFDPRSITVAELDRYRDALPAGGELVPCPGVVSGLREIKDASELESVAAAAALADEALGTVLESGLVGRTESDIAWAIEKAIRDRGAEGLSFEPIVAAGAHGARPHASPRPEPIPGEALVVIDWGARLDGYCSDCTRTFATGPIDVDAAHAYRTVLDAQRRACDQVRAGLTGAELDAIARTAIGEAGLGDLFGHGLGHGVGLEVHEGPRISKSGNSPLEAGNVITIEPGIYMPGRFGIRIEDLLVVDRDGARALTTMPRDLIEVG